jgi:lipopolysaccharide/colanic/teichoic acid biosynthesis glycosyltransferase
MHANNQVNGHVWADVSTQNFYVDHIKRTMDICLVLIAAPICIVIIFVLAVVNYTKGGSPFYAQERVGKRGKLFNCWKLRTMVLDSDAKLIAHLKNCPDAHAEWQANNKLTNDPRVTSFGRFLRKSSLDELPQLLNIIRGEMSIVGPRPVVADELEKYGTHVQHYLSMRPGLTGLWQTSGRNAISYDGRIAMDVAYRKSVSLLLDIRIIIATVGVVFARTGM